MGSNLDPKFLSFFLSTLHLFFSISLSQSSSDQSESTGEGFGADWTENWHGGNHLLHVLAGDDVFVAIMILVMVGFSVADGIG